MADKGKGKALLKKGNLKKMAAVEFHTKKLRKLTKQKFSPADSKLYISEAEFIGKKIEKIRKEFVDDLKQYKSNEKKLPAKKKDPLYNKFKGALDGMVKDVVGLSKIIDKMDADPGERKKISGALKKSHKTMLGYEKDFKKGFE